MARKKLSFLFIFLLLLIAQAQAQVWELGAQVGGAGYTGDLNPVNPIKISGISAGVFAKANLDPYWAAGLYYTFGKIKADDAKSKDLQAQTRNLNFHSPLHEISVIFDFNFFDYFAGGGSKRFTPYLYVGVGGIIFNPQTEYNGENYKLVHYKTEGVSYKNYAVTMPYGAGVKYNFKSNWNVFSQIGYRNAYTDYLDDVSGNYLDPKNADPLVPGIQRALGDRSGEKNGVFIGSPNTQRGDFRKRDTYMFVGIGISYTFVSQKCYNY